MPPARGCSKETAVDKAYLEDLAPGQVFTSDARTVVDADAIPVTRVDQEARPGGELGDRG